MLPALALFSCQEHDPFAEKTITGREMAMDLIEHREKATPGQGGNAPSLTLTEINSGKKVPISKYWQNKPAILIFGSLSCDRTCDGAADVNNLSRIYGEEFQFVFIYIREAHPVDGWYNRKGYPRVLDPATLEIRRNVAGRLCRKLQFDFPVLADSMDDRAAIAYAAWPARMFVVDRDGIIQYRGDPGPWGYRVGKSATFFLQEQEMEGKTDLPDPLKAVSLEEWLMAQ